MGGARLGLRLARRNLWRNRRRTLLSLSAVAFATAILVFMISIQRSGYRAMISSTLGVFTGDLQVQASGYLDRPTLEKHLDGAAALEQRVAGVPGVAAVAVRARSYALASAPSQTLGAAVIGVQPDREPLLSTIPHSIREGRFLRAPEASEAVVGATLARNLGLELGDTLTLLGQGNDGSLAAATLTVVGLFTSGTPDVDRAVLEIPLQTFQGVFALPDGANSIAVRVDDLDHVDRTAAAIAAALAPAEGIAVLTWPRLVEGLKQGITLDETIGWFMYAVLVLLVTFSVLNTFLMAVLERTREFGVLLSLGTRPSFLGRVVMTESLLLLTMGLVAGVLLGSGVTLLAGHYGVAMSSNEALMSQWNLPARIYPTLDTFSLMVGPLVILIVTALAALFPPLRIRRLHPVEAMKAV